VGAPEKLDHAGPEIMAQAKDTPLDGHTCFGERREIVLIALPGSLRVGESGIKVRRQTGRHFTQVAIVRVDIHTGWRCGVDVPVLPLDALVGPPTGAGVAAAGERCHALAVQYRGGSFAGHSDVRGVVCVDRRAEVHTVVALPTTVVQLPVRAAIDRAVLGV